MPATTTPAAQPRHRHPDGGHPCACKYPFLPVTPGNHLAAEQGARQMVAVITLADRLVAPGRPPQLPPGAEAGTLAGTIAELRGTRALYRKMLQTAVSLRDLGRDDTAAEVAADAALLGNVLFAVQVPCACCQRPGPAQVLVGDPQHPEPESGICAECDAATTAQAGPGAAPPGGRCTASSWRGKSQKPYGPGGYNRCVLTGPHGPHRDDFGNVFVVEPKFKVLRHEKPAQPAAGEASGG